ncbi:MAG: hypothetical protein ACLQVL_24905 [Terriglobia bacterium]
MLKKHLREERPSYFVSYSTREPHTKLLIECLGMVFKGRFEMKITPSALQSGSSQREQITDMIGGCSFAVVCLDGLRPNVVFEYGVLHGKNIPIMLFKEAEAQVDIKGFVRESTGLGIGSFPLDVDLQFSDVKDVNYATWNRFEVANTVKLIWGEYRKKKNEIKGYIEIPEFNLCP